MRPNTVAAIEGAQVPNHQGLDGFTLFELLRVLNVPGASVAVIDNFAIDWAGGWGVADSATGRPIGANTLFQAASISKTVAAMASVVAVQDGHFALDDDVNAILKSWRLPLGSFGGDAAVTPRMLLSHTAGLGDGFGFPGYEAAAALPTVPEILDGASPSCTGPVRLVRRPMSAYAYSGGGTMIQQLALSDATGMGFARYAKERVLDPLEMNDSTFEQPLPEQFVQNAARAHDAAGQPMGEPWHVYPEQAAAGLWTTATDLAKFALSVQQTMASHAHGIVRRAQLAEMLTPVGIGPFAVGFTIEKLGEGWYFSHGGSNWGFRCILRAHFRKGYGIAVMTNGENGDLVVQEIVDRVQRAYGWDSLDKPISRFPAKVHS